MSNFISGLMAQLAAKATLIGLSVVVAAIGGAAYMVTRGDVPLLDTLRGNLTEIGTKPALIPAAEPDGPEIKTTLPEENTPQAEPAIEPGTPPTFDVVRVASSGEAVITGFSTPNERIEIVSNGAVIAQAEVGNSGDWAIVLDKALPPGGHNLIVRAVQPGSGKIVVSAQSVTVAILENADDTPIVLLDQPGQAGELLQGPTGPSFTLQDDPAMTFDVAVALALKENIAAETIEADTTPVEQPSEALPEETLPEENLQIVAQTTEPEQAPDKTPQLAVLINSSTVADARNEMAMRGNWTTSKTVDVAALEPAEEPKTPDVVAQDPDIFVTVEAVEAEIEGALYAAGAANPGATVRVYFDEDLIGETKAGDKGRWLLEANRKLPVGQYAVRVEQVEQSNGKVLARREVSFARSADLVSLIPSTKEGGSPTSDPAQLPNAVIIRKGDNLWSISRRLYGSGTRYTTIYSANGDQIRNPALIYPGQVFVLP
ncbi:MAG: hypothetical protein COA52_15745 [Hyphomicrobiales bacterium]|nr:MAG: hypothetical protein COA52_15745 [Hyphomicrobiales bacterium]